MPNWVENIVKVYGSNQKLQELKQKMKTDNYAFDFSVLIPRPAYIDWVYKYPDVDVPGFLDKEILKSFYHLPTVSEEKKQKILKTLNVTSPEQMRMYVEPDKMKEALKKWPKELKEYGKVLMDALMSDEEITGWYGWQSANWGTKWNACEAKLVEEHYNKNGEGSLEYCFNTAWSEPDPIILKLSETFPEVTIEWQWIEEQGVENVGERTYENGEMVSECWPESGSKEAYDMMFERWGNRDSYFYNPELDTYEYADDCKHLYLIYENGEYRDCMVANSKKEVIEGWSGGFNYDTMTIKVAKQ